MNWILITFTVSYFLLEAYHDYYVWLDYKNQRDNANPARRAYHLLSVLQGAILFIFLGAIIFLRLQFDIQPVKYALVIIFIRWVVLDLVFNALRNPRIFYVEKDNMIGGAVHWVADKIKIIPAEILMLVFKAILLLLIIFL